MGIIYLGPEKQWRSLHAPSGYCMAKSPGKASGERFPLAVINPCGLGDLSTRHPLAPQLLGSQTIVSGLLSQTEELRDQAFQVSPSQSDWLAAWHLLRPFLALLLRSQLGLDPFQ